MDLCNITNPSYRLVLVQCSLSEAQQEAVAHILESDMPASEAYSQLRAELTHLHQKSSWDQLGDSSPRRRTCGSGGSKYFSYRHNLLIM